MTVWTESGQDPRERQPANKMERQDIMSEMFKSRLFRAGIWILLIFIIILVGNQISFVFWPLIITLQTLFFPFLLAGLLYFLIHPAVDWLELKKLPRWLSVLLLYLVIIALVTLAASFIGPLLQREFVRLMDDFPRIMGELNLIILSLQENPLVLRFLAERPDFMEQTAGWLTGLLGNFFSMLIANITHYATVLFDFFITLVMVPFILFYMLRDGQQWPQLLYRQLHRQHAEGIHRTLKEIEKGISAYIQGVFVVCLCVGVLVYTGYLIIGLDYPLLLALFLMATNVIPFFGPIIGAVPAIVVAALHSPLMVLKVLAVVVAVQQIESLLVSPHVMGRKLAISPLTVTLLVLVSGSMAGLFGMILALPAFVILKIIVLNIFKYIRPEK